VQIVSKNIKWRTSHIIGSYWNLASVGSSLCTQNTLLKAKTSKIFVHQWLNSRKSSEGRHQGAEETTVGIPIPRAGNSSTAVHDDDHDDGGSARLGRCVAGGIKNYYPQVRHQLCF